MKQLNRTNFSLPKYPTKIMQFGEGNFLRAFVDWQLDQLNEKTDLNAGISVIRPIDYEAPLLDEQEGLYTTIIRGINEQGQPQEDLRIISSINEEIPVYKEFDRYMDLAKNPDIELIFSNTTEAGIDYNEQDKLTDKPAATYPAKLTQWLYHRYTYFNNSEQNGAQNKGLFIIPCELIDYNGEKLKEIVFKYTQLWQLEEGFKQWLETANTFCSSLVDRIVTGHPRAEHQALQEKAGYLDRFMVTGEYFHLFVIQAPTKKQQQRLAELLHLTKEVPLNIKIVDNIGPYKERKVAILNGAHTAMVPLSYLSGLDTVGETMADPILSTYVAQLIKKEIIPTLNLPESELITFADEVSMRFQNPYIQHQLLSISLNSMTKFTTRLVPQLTVYLNQGKTPVLMALAFAAQCLFYKGERAGVPFTRTDDTKWLTLFADLWTKVDNKQISLKELVTTVFADTQHWGIDFSNYPAFIELVTKDLELFLTKGVRSVIEQTLVTIN